MSKLKNLKYLVLFFSIILPSWGSDDGHEERGNSTSPRSSTNSARAAGGVDSDEEAPGTVINPPQQIGDEQYQDRLSLIEEEIKKLRIDREEKFKEEKQELDEDIKDNLKWRNRCGFFAGTTTSSAPKIVTGIALIIGGWVVILQKNSYAPCSGDNSIYRINQNASLVDILSSGQLLDFSHINPLPNTRGYYEISQLCPSSSNLTLGITAIAGGLYAIVSGIADGALATHCCTKKLLKSIRSLGDKIRRKKNKKNYKDDEFDIVIGEFQDLANKRGPFNQEKFFQAVTK